MTPRQFTSLALGMIGGFVFLALVTGSLRDGDSEGAVMWGLAGACSLFSLVSLAVADRKGGKRCIKTEQPK